MTAHWSFEDSHLVARDNAGTLVGAWLADETIGKPLSNLLNHDPKLSQLLLPPGVAMQKSMFNL